MQDEDSEDRPLSFIQWMASNGRDPFEYIESYADYLAYEALMRERRRCAKIVADEAGKNRPREDLIHVIATKIEEDWR